MGIKSFLAKPYAKWAIKQNQKWINYPVETQAKVFQNLIVTAATTVFGKDHNFSTIKNHQDFKAQVSVQDYEGLKKYSGYWRWPDGGWYRSGVCIKRLQG